MGDKDISHLEWIYERMKYIHNENEDYDYMIRFREILKALRSSLVTLKEETTTNEKPVLPAGYISVETDLPPLNKHVKCFMDNGTETVGYRYDNLYRGGWMTMYGGGLYANQIWSGIKVIGWQ